MKRNTIKPETDPQKAFMLSVALGAIADVRQSEKPRSRRERLLKNCEDDICDRVDEYRPDAWDHEMMAKADRLLDKINELIREEFGHTQ